MKWGDAALESALKNPDIAVPDDTTTDSTDAARRYAKAQRQAQRRVLADKFERLWSAAGGPTLTPEYRFHETRKWQADYCHEGTKTLIELEGGTRKQGRHNRHDGYAADCEKYNAAIMAGYSLIRLTGDMITADNVHMILDFVTEVTR